MSGFQDSGVLGFKGCVLKFLFLGLSLEPMTPILPHYPGSPEFFQDVLSSFNSKEGSTLPLFLEGFGFHLTESDSILVGIRGK